MPDPKAIYAELRQPLLRTGALLLVILILVLAASVFSSRMDHARKSAQQQLQSSLYEYRAALESERILRTDAGRFAALQARHFVGPEPRLKWIENLRMAAHDAGLVAFRYELEPRHGRPDTQGDGIYQLFESSMKLVLELRHEGDLSRFLRLLEQRGDGLFEVVACGLRPTRDGGEVSLDEANVTADCALRWYSLDAPDANPDEGWQ
ncbi:MAG TPA: hypothetical protein VIQ75_08410 [Gammaproteobacteria bacterium]